MSFELPVQEPVDRMDIVRYYIQAERENFPDDSFDIEMLTHHQLMMKLFVYSEQLRKNSIFNVLNRKDLQWGLVHVPIEEITLTPVNPRANVVLEYCEYDLVKFTHYLQTYFGQYPGSDPEGLDEFRPDASRGKVVHRNLIARIYDGKIKIIDGMHRAVAMVMDRSEELSIYIGTKP